MNPPWLDIAINELGVHETPGPASTARIQEYMDTVGYHHQPDEVPWCAGFVEWCLEQAGLEGTKSAAAISYQNWGEELALCQTGAILVFEWSNGGHHVAFCIERDQYFVKVIGGNQHDKVCYAHFPVDAVIARRWPEGYPKEV